VEVARQRGIEWRAASIIHPSSAARSVCQWRLPLRPTPPASLVSKPTQAPKAEGVYYSHATQPASYRLGQSRERLDWTRPDLTRLQDAHACALLVLVLVLMQPTCSRHSSIYPDLSYGTALSTAASQAGAAKHSNPALMDTDYNHGHDHDHDYGVRSTLQHSNIEWGGVVQTPSLSSPPLPSIPIHISPSFCISHSMDRQWTALSN
jgi:hypothetical protein